MRYEDTEFDPATDADREAAAREALRLASHKLPIKTKIIKREENKMGGEEQ